MTSMRHLHFPLVLSMWTLAQATAQTNYIRQWNLSVPTSAYEIVQADRRIVIKTGSTEIFKFEAFIVEEPNTPGDINIIETDDDGAGQVLLMVHGDPSYGRTWGAENLKGIDLRYDTSVSKLQGVRVHGNLGQPYGVDVHQVLNYVIVHGDLYGGIYAISGSASITVDGTSHSTISFSSGTSGAITIGGQMLGNITAYTLGNVTVNGLGTHTGDITVQQQSYSGNVFLNGTYAGDMSFTPALSGKVTLGSLAGSLKVNGTLSGEVRINGSLLNGAQANDVWVTTGIGSGGAITVDYNGWQEGDDWAADAVVRVGGATYTRDNWVAPVYEVTGCRGDMNNDRFVDFGDINPFTLALSDPTGYASAFPGLERSMVWHGDVNCDGSFDFADINPFVALMEHQCCMLWDCAPCWDGDGAERMSPRQLAAALATHIWAELHDDLVWVVGEAIDWQDNDADRAYWQAVYDALTQ